jgi:hypothetical protein
MLHKQLQPVQDTYAVRPSIVIEMLLAVLEILSEFSFGTRIASAARQSSVSRSSTQRLLTRDPPIFSMRYLARKQIRLNIHKQYWSVQMSVTI